MMKRTVAASWMVRLGLTLDLVVTALVAVLPVIPPNPVPASSPKSTFSAQRAMEDLEVVARAPHPIGSAEQERVRDYILAQAQALGLPTEVQKAEVAPGRTAENIIVRLPGTADTSRDVLITAHYDSAPPSPGAGDAGISVAAMLETMRVLEAGDPLRNEVVFLFTDGDRAQGGEPERDQRAHIPGEGPSSKLVERVPGSALHSFAHTVPLTPTTTPRAAEGSVHDVATYPSMAGADAPPGGWRAQAFIGSYCGGGLNARWATASSIGKIKTVRASPSRP